MAKLDRVETLTKCTKTELLALAAEKKITVRKSWKKDKIIESLTAAEGSKKKGAAVNKKKSVKKSKNQKKMDEYIQHSMSSSACVSSDASTRTNMEDTKFDIGSSMSQVAHQEYPIPERYGEPCFTLIFRDPYWIFAYWELTDDLLDKARSEFGEGFPYAKPCLRVSYATGKSTTFFDVEVYLGASNWYINVPLPDTSYVAEIGLKLDGKFCPLIHSNAVKTPAATISEEVDEKWMVIEKVFQNIYGMAANPADPQSNSAQLRESVMRKIHESLQSSVSSSSVTSAAPVRQRNDKFWFVVNTDLIIYGATEPGAKVTLLGEPVSLKPDGTFSMRFALPDGEQKLECKAISSDLAHEISITPIVKKETH